MMDQHLDKNIYYFEEQRFRQKWLWVLLLLSTLFITIFFAYGTVKQIMLGQPWGNRPMSDTALIIIGSISIALMGGMTYLFYKLKLITEVRNDSVNIRFFPVSHLQIIPLHNIKKCEIRQYRPVMEYGGWGIRYGRRGKAYNVSGNRGVQLELFQGKPLLIGSQRPDELAQAINSLMKR